MATICLSMIVKDEAHIIERCLASVKPYISCWSICDTGSTDDTKRIILDTMADIPGRLIEAEWVDFATNRNLALMPALHSHADYVLSIDADEWLEVYDDRWYEYLDKDAYAVLHRFDKTAFPTLRLVSTRLPWKWVGMIHEVLEAPSMPDMYPLEGASLSTDNDGARSRDPEEYAKDLVLLDRAIAADPDDTRMLFYRAVTLGCMERYEEALAAFRERSRHQGGNQEERWYANYQGGILYLRLGEAERAIKRLETAYLLNPFRAEPLFWLGMQYFNKFQYGAALALFKAVVSTEKPVGMFVEEEVYDYKGAFMFAMCCAFGGPRDLAIGIRRQLNEEHLLSEEEDGALGQALDISSKS